MSARGNNSATVNNPGVDQVIVASSALFAAEYRVQFTASSSNGTGKTAFQLLRGVNNVVLVPFKESNGGLEKWGFTAVTKAGDIFQVVSKTADAREVDGSVTWQLTGAAE